MFKNSYWFDDHGRKVAGQQKIVEMYQIFLRYYQWSRSIIMKKEAKVLFDGIIVSKIARNFELVKCIYILGIVKVEVYL